MSLARGDLTQGDLALGVAERRDVDHEAQRIAPLGRYEHARLLHLRSHRPSNQPMGTGVIGWSGAGYRPTPDCSTSQ